MTRNHAGSPNARSLATTAHCLCPTRLTIGIQKGPSGPFLIPMCRLDVARSRAGAPGKSRDLRTLISDNPIKDARELFKQLSEGGDIVPTDNPHQILYLLPGGTYVSLRIITSTEGSPAVEINVKSDKANTKVKSQKIHFIKKGE